MGSSFSGICDFGQLRSLGDDGETVSFFCKADLFAAGLTGYILMTVQDDLCAERRMTGHLDGDVSPVWVDDVERVVIDERPLGFEIANHSLLRSLDLPHGGHGSAHQDEKESTSA